MSVKLKQVLNLAGAASRLADLIVKIGKTCMTLNNLKFFLRLFASSVCLE